MKSHCVNNRAMRWLWVMVPVCAVGVADAAQGQERPEALKKIEAYRAALRTGHVEWSLVDNTPNARSYRGHVRFRTSKFADDDLITVLRGDPNGVVARNTAGKVAAHVGMKPDYTLRADGQVWTRVDHPFESASVFPEGVTGGGSDLRTLGVAAGIVYCDIHNCLWHDTSPNPVAWQYQQSPEGDLHVVRVRQSRATKTLWLDPRRAWSPVRVRYEHDSGMWSESRSALKQMDGVWFPEAVHVFTSTHEDGREAAQIVRVYSATFNRPEHPSRLTPADIGVEVGTDIVVYDEHRNARPAKWDGEHIVSLSEFAERRLQEGPNLTREVARAQAKEAAELRAEATPVLMDGINAQALRHAVTQKPAQCESLWEAYTRAFIQRYKLNEEQTQKALSILHDCQERGRAYLVQHKDELAELDDRAKKLAEQTGVKRDKERANIRRQRERLAKPLNDIFEQQLKPRLDKLPTRAQRKAAEDAATTRPTTQRAD